MDQHTELNQVTKKTLSTRANCLQRRFLHSTFLQRHFSYPTFQTPSSTSVRNQIISIINTFTSSTTTVSTWKETQPSIKQANEKRLSTKAEAKHTRRKRIPGAALQVGSRGAARKSRSLSLSGAPARRPFPRVLLSCPRRSNDRERRQSRLRFNRT